MIKLEALRHYGGPHPVALINIDATTLIYDLDGIRDLMKVYRNHNEYPVLVDIERQMLMPGEYDDIQEEDFSGQQTLFKAD